MVDVHGRPVAAGRIRLDSLHSQPKTESANLGLWTLVSAVPGFPADAAASGPCEAEDDAAKKFDTTPGQTEVFLSYGGSDNNIVLEGKLVNGRFAGSWWHMTYAGRVDGGTFASN